MPDYRRNRVAGGTFFFTVNLLDRRSDLLVTQIQALRAAVLLVRRHAPFHIDAWVVLPAPYALPVDLTGRQCQLSRSLARDLDGILESFARL